MPITPRDRSVANHAFGPFEANDRPAVGKPVVTYSVVPAALAAANLSAAAAILAGASAVLVAGAGVTAKSTAQSGVRYVLDVPRNVRITSAGDDSAKTFLVSGFDAYGFAMSERITGANAGVASGKKAFAAVASVTPSAATAGTVSVGTGDVFGLPVKVADGGTVLACSWAGGFARDTGTFVAADASAATALTGDVRGTYAPSSASNGVRRLSVSIAADADATVSLYGTKQA